MDLEQLMKVEVTTASKKAQPLFDVPAAVSVISAEDIKRMGVRNIPDLLRMVPGMDVSQVTASRYAISARGFNFEYANKLLVLVDGRSVYEPLFSGVFWDAHDLPLDNINRIEVIRGPGGTIWGSNAVNGVINIITKKSANTQGGYAQVGAGSQDKLIGSARYGGKFGKDGSFRVFGQYRDEAPTLTPSGGDNLDGWTGRSVGFRADWGPATSQMMVEAGAYGNVLDHPADRPSLTPPFNVQVPFTEHATGSYVNATWQKTWNSGSKTTVQGYFDRSNRDMHEIYEARDTYNLDVANQVALGKNSIVYGAGYRTNQDRTIATSIVSFTPADARQDLYNLFIQDEASIDAKDKLTLGLKAEHNQFSGWELQPNARLAHKFDANRMGWLAVSRAVRTPNRSDDDATINAEVVPTPQNLPGLVQFENSDISSEALVAYEAGYRVNFKEKLLVDTSAFYNDYTNLRSTEQLAPFFDPSPVPHLVLPFRYINGLKARTAGLEVEARYHPGGAWSFGGAYAYLSRRFRHDAGSMTDFQTDIDVTPRNMANVYASYQPSEKFLSNVQLYYTDAKVYSSAGALSGSVPAGFRLDANFVWKASKSLDFNLNFQNLLTPRRPEATTVGFSIPGQVERSVFAGVTCRF